MTDRVIVAEPDPAWRARYRAEEQRLWAAVGAWTVAIEHIGSTSVPGLAAKPVIDVLVGVRSLEDGAACIEAITALGYTYVPEYEQIMPYRRFFKRDEGGQRSHHVHLVERTHPFYTEHVALRDYLRAHPAVAGEYGELKRDLADRFADDREGYMAGKASLIRRMNAQALAWQRALVEVASDWTASPER